MNASKQKLTYLFIYGDVHKWLRWFLSFFDPLAPPPPLIKCFVSTPLLMKSDLVEPPPPFLPSVVIALQNLTNMTTLTFLHTKPSP